MFLVIIFLLTLSFTGDVYSQSSSSDSLNSSVKIWAGISITCTDVQFPDIVAGIGYADSAIRSDHTSYVPGGANGHNASCTVTGETGKSYKAVLPTTPVNMTNGVSIIPITSFGCTIPGCISTIGNNFEIASKLGQVEVSDTAGDYQTSDLTIEVHYGTS